MASLADFSLDATELQSSGFDASSYRSAKSTALVISRSAKLHLPTINVRRFICIENDVIIDSEQAKVFQISHFLQFISSRHSGRYWIILCD